MSAARSASGPRSGRPVVARMLGAGTGAAVVALPRPGEPEDCASGGRGRRGRRQRRVGGRPSRRSVAGGRALAGSGVAGGRRRRSAGRRLRRGRLVAGGLAATVSTAGPRHHQPDDRQRGRRGQPTGEQAVAASSSGAIDRHDRPAADGARRRVAGGDRTRCTHCTHCRGAGISDRRESSQGCGQHRLALLGRERLDRLGQRISDLAMALDQGHHARVGLDQGPLIVRQLAVQVGRRQLVGIEREVVGRVAHGRSL